MCAKFKSENYANKREKCEIENVALHHKFSQNTSRTMSALRLFQLNLFAIMPTRKQEKEFEIFQRSAHPPEKKKAFVK